MPTRGHHRSSCRGIRTVAVEHQGHAHRAKKRLLRRGQELLACMNIRTADEYGSVFQRSASACEHRSMHQITYFRRLYATVSEQVIDTRVDGDHAVENARLWVGVEADENVWRHGRCNDEDQMKYERKDDEARMTNDDTVRHSSLDIRYFLKR